MPPRPQILRGALRLYTSRQISLQGLLTGAPSACGREGPIPLQPSGSGDEGGSLKSGAEKATGASLSQVRDADLRIQQDAARLSSASAGNNKER